MYGSAPKQVTLIEIPFADIRERFLRARKEGQWKGQPILDRCVKQDWTRPSAARWTGGTGEDTEGWLRDGYRAKAFAVNALDVQPRPRQRAQWSEEDGDLDPGRLYGGADEYMLTQANRDSIPGLTLEIEYDFSASAKSRDIAAYGSWLARLVTALEASGYDLDVKIVIRATDLFKTDGYAKRTDLHIQVKDAGAVGDFTGWSALFAPTGFRHLIFTAYGLAAEAIGKTLAKGLGGPVTSGWGCAREGHIISITCDSRGREAFDLKTINSEAKKAGILQ